MDGSFLTINLMQALGNLPNYIALSLALSQCFKDIVCKGLSKEFDGSQGALMPWFDCIKEQHINECLVDDTWLQGDC